MVVFSAMVSPPTSSSTNTSGNLFPPSSDKQVTNPLHT
jgi:hypothetical protein